MKRPRSPSSPAPIHVLRIGLLATLLLLLGIVPVRLPQAASGHEPGSPHSEPLDPAPGPDPPARYLALVSIDGFRPDFYLDEGWPAPMLQQMAREGAHAEAMTGVFPSVTYPAHTTMVTGAYPATHGILFNTRFREGGYYFEYDSIQVETIWGAAALRGLTTANVGWPVTLDAPFDVNIPISGALQGSGLTDDPIRDFTRPAGLFEELEREATGRIRPGDLANQSPSKEIRVAEMAAHIVRTRRPHVLTVALQHTDAAQHRYGRENPRVRRAVAGADRALARIVEAYEDAGILEDTVFVVGGDHGFTDIHHLLAPNVWLAEAGIRTDPSEEGWEATFVTAAGAAFLYLADPDDRAALERVRGVLDVLPDATRRHFLFVERAELDELQANPYAAFALSGTATTSFIGTSEGPGLRPPGNRGTHGHLPTLQEMKIGFVAWGAGIRPRTALPGFHLVDLAPTAAALLGIHLSEADGIPIPGLLLDPLPLLEDLEAPAGPPPH